MFDAGKVLYLFFPVSFPKDPALVYREEIRQITEPIGYFVTPYNHVYGVINYGTLRIILGPTAQVFAGDKQLRELAFQADVPKEDVPAFVDAVKSLTRMPTETLLRMMCPIYYILSGEKKELKDISIRDEVQLDIKKQIENQRTAEKYEFGGNAVPQQHHPD